MAPESAGHTRTRYSLHHEFGPSEEQAAVAELTFSGTTLAICAYRCVR